MPKLRSPAPVRALDAPTGASALSAIEDAAASPEAQQFLAQNLPVVPLDLDADRIAGTRRQLATLYEPDARATVREFDLRLSRVELGGVGTLCITPPNALGVGGASAPRLFYLFGGGYVTGAPDLDLPISGALSARLGARVFAPEYRLAPEARYPGALDDALAAYRAFVAAEDGPFWVVGESAGGGLALATLQRARAEGSRMPAALALMSPWVDLSDGTPCANDGRDPTFTRRNLTEAARLYAGEGRDLTQPGMSPLFGSLRNLPPVIITTGSRDILREQAQALANAIASAGGVVELHDWPGLWHVFEFTRTLPEAAISLGRIATFLRAHLPSTRR